MFLQAIGTVDFNRISTVSPALTLKEVFSI
jgi:hypothetical protein